MKKFLFVLIVFVNYAMIAFSQVAVSFDNPEIEFTFKRCVCSGKTAYIDFTITNNTRSDIRGYYNRDRTKGLGYSNHFTAAYDDEGNVYRFNGSDCIIASISVPGGNVINELNLPVGIPVKMRITLQGVDEYAAEISLLKIAFSAMTRTNPYGNALLEVRNIPISR